VSEIEITVGEREAETRRALELFVEATRESVCGCPRCHGIGWKTWWLWPYRCRFCRGFGTVRCYDGKPIRR
jgi:hypothetical protein